jgi:hypothetical protein
VFSLQLIMVVLIAVCLMWLPVEPDMPRLMGVLPWRFEGSPTLGVILLAAVAVWTVVVHRMFSGFEQRYWRTLGVLCLGLVGIGLLPGGMTQGLRGFVFFILVAAGLFGPDLPYLLDRMRGWRRSDVFGRARFEDDRSAAEKAGLSGPL